MDKSRPVTIKTIAEALGVSVTTVSKALRDRDDISRDTKVKVKELAEKLNYHPNIIAKSLSSGRTCMIGAIVPELKTSFFAAVARGIYEKAQAAGYNPILMVSNDCSDNEQQGLLFLSSFPVDGILIAISHDSTNIDLLKRLQEQGIAVVLYDRKADDSNFTSVTIDDEKASTLLVDHLISFGRKNIAYVGKYERMSIAKDRFQGYLNALKAHGIKPKKEYWIECEVNLEEGYRKTKQLLASQSRPDAIVCTSDLVALGAGEAILEANLTIPNDIALAGFGNIDQIDRLGVKYFTIDQNPFMMGLKAVELVLAAIENKDKPRQIEHAIVESKLILRESLGASIIPI